MAFSVRCAVECSRVHQMHRRESGAQSPVCGRFANLSGYESGEHRTHQRESGAQHPVPEVLHTSLSFSPVCTRRVRCEPTERPVVRR